MGLVAQIGKHNSVANPGSSAAADPAIVRVPAVPGSVWNDDQVRSCQRIS